MPTPLPDRPNLEQLKKQAKSLLAAARAGETSALTRFTALPAFSKTPLAELDARSIALHDAQSLIAREHGFPSWNALRDEVEARTLSFDAALEEFVRSASGGAAARAERLLALHPRIASASFHAALLLGDATAVEKYLERDPQLATAVGGPMQWHPLLYVCHSCIAGGRPSGRDGVVAIARQLCALGADPNDQYHWNWHPELPRTVLWAALVTMRHFPLAEVLLEAGANPTDGVSVHIAGGKGDIAMLELLHRYGADVNGIPGGVPPLVYMMGFATDPAGPRWLLEHGADSNRAWGDEDEAPLHVAARRWDVAMVEALITHGADPVRRRRDGRTPHTVAEMYGNHDIAGRLLELGAMDELSPLERFIAVCGRGDSAAARAMLAATPGLRRDLQPEHHLMLHRPAESGNTAVLQAMLESGFEADARDKDQVTPLHRAAMGGHVDAVRTLLAHGANVNALDGMFSASPLVWAVEGRNHPREGSDHVGVARVLITSGVSTEWRVPDGAPNPEQTLEGLRQLCRDAAGTGT